MGLENLLNTMRDQDGNLSLTDAWEFSDNVHEFDSETLLATIMIKGAQFEPLYTDPTFFYRMNGMWWRKWKPTFEGWCTVLEKEYEPLWNKNYWELEHQDTTDAGTNDTVKGSTEVMADETAYNKGGTNTEVMADETAGTKDSTETIDDLIVGSKTSIEVIDAETGGTKTSSETVDGDTTYSKSGTNKEVTDKGTTESETIQTVDQLSGSDKTVHDYDKNINTTNEVSAFDAPANDPYTPHDTSVTHDKLNVENTTTTYGKKDTINTTKSGSGTEDTTVTTTYSENGSGTEDRKTDYTETTTGSEDRETQTTDTSRSDEDKSTVYTEATTGTDDRTTTTTWSESGSGTDDRTTTFNETIGNETSNDRDFDRDLHAYGNIGVTTTQKLVMEELQVRYFNIYERMSDIFLNEMAVRVY